MSRPILSTKNVSEETLALTLGLVVSAWELLESCTWEVTELWAVELRVQGLELLCCPAQN